jgi:uncharacterized membrane protein
MEKWRDLIIGTATLVAINAVLIAIGKATIADFLFYLSIIAYCDFIVAIYVQHRFETAKTMGKMVDSVEDLLKKMSRKKGKKRQAKRALAIIEEAKEEVKENVS